MVAASQRRTMLAETEGGLTPRSQTRPERRPEEELRGRAAFRHAVGYAVY